MAENEESDPTKVAYWEAFWNRPFGPREGGINWRGPNLWTAFAFAAALILSQLIKRPLPWGWTWTDVSPTLSYLFALLSSRIGHSYERAIDEFTPRSVVEAKRANEQIKAVSNLINAAAAATLSIFAFSEIVRSPAPQWGNIICAGAAAFWVHLTARRLLGHLVDEAIPT